jgi:CHAT domain-containing protein/Tfp pilus assembly protein PilF
MRRLSTGVVITLGIAGITPTWQSVHRASAQTPNVIALQPPKTTAGGDENGYALPSADPERAIQESRSLRTDASQLETDGQFTRARDLLERALTITVTVKGASDLEVAAVAAQLAGVYRSLPDSMKSEALYRRAIAIREAALGTGDPLTALARSQLAVLYQHTGDRRKAEALLGDAMATIEKTLGQEHPWFVSCLITLANLRNDARDLEEEEQILRRAIAISERIDETNSVQFARLLNNLGELYRQKQDYSRAERLFSQALALEEALVGGGKYGVATALQNLGVIARERKEYDKAIAYYTRALSIRERAVGANHPDVAQLLTNLANIYRATGNYAQSLEMSHRALSIWQSAAGPYQQATLLSTGNIARTYAASGDMEHALEYQRRSDAIVEVQLELNLAVGSERQKLAFARSVAERTDRTISLDLNGAGINPAATALAALVVLQRKGRVLDAMTDTFASVRRRVTNLRDRDLVDELKATTTQLARLALGLAGDRPGDDRREAVQDLVARKEQLEAELSAHSADFRMERRPVTIEAVQRAIPADAALVEYVVYHPFDPRAERNSEAYGPAHYAAYTLRRDGSVAGVDLGEASRIDERVATLREALHDPRCPDLRSRARTVAAQILAPIRGSIGTATRLLISPDGDLSLIPFEALIDERGNYLIERYAISYLTSGRDLLRMNRPPVANTAPVVIADPVFGESTIAPNAPSLASRSPASSPGDASPMYFAPLGGTAAEAKAIKALFPGTTLLSGRHATKTALQRVRAPRILHIASHGFFLRNDAVAPFTPAAAAGTDLNAPADRLDNPLLRSGLALAGANLARSSGGDGILTALEASGLDLWGTKLVTLSACDTGIGEVRNGEGVYGLRRAFVLAGTETVVMSLWQVGDSIARQTMVTYYSGLRGGLGRGDALRQAKLAVLRQRGRQHPYYWASFIQSGEWATLDGHRPPASKSVAAHSASH